MGYQFSPRLADVGSAILYRADPDADYGPLNPVTRDKINLKQITANWDEMLRLAGSLHSGTIKASEALRILAPGGKLTPTGKALMELGRLDCSAYLSSYFTDELLRRRVNTQLDRQESRHELARKIFRRKPRQRLTGIGLGPSRTWAPTRWAQLRGGRTSMTVAVPTAGRPSCMVITSPGFRFLHCSGLSGASRTSAVSPGPSSCANSTHTKAMFRSRSPSEVRLPMSHRGRS